MFLLRKPTEPQIRAVLADQQQRSFTYPDVGASRGEPPARYNVDRNRTRLGDGAATFERAREAVRGWEMFRIGWVELAWPSASIEVGTTVGILARALGLWSLNACRIVYVVDEESGGVRRFGFAYGTLEEHAESGEERFTVEHREEDDGVFYDILAFSRPHQVLARAGYPYTRALQRRFARDSMRAMRRAVGGER